MNRLPSAQKQDFIKKNIVPLIIILIGLMIIAFFGLKLLIPTNPPLIKFFDEQKNIGLAGSVYLNNNYLGETEETEGAQFNLLPEEFCQQPSILTLKTTDQSYEWNTYPSDCKAKTVIYKVSTAKPIAGKKEITMNFFIQETAQPIAGDLYFDDLLINSISGMYELSQEQCKKITKITITTAEKYATWQHNPQWCDTNQVINYKIAENNLLS